MDCGGRILPWCGGVSYTAAHILWLHITSRQLELGLNKKKYFLYDAVQCKPVFKVALGLRLENEQDRATK